MQRWAHWAPSAASPGKREANSIPSAAILKRNMHKFASGTTLGQFQAIASNFPEQCLANTRLLSASSGGSTPCREQHLVEKGGANSELSAGIWR